MLGAKTRARVSPTAAFLKVACSFSWKRAHTKKKKKKKRRHHIILPHPPSHLESPAQKRNRGQGVHPENSPFQSAREKVWDHRNVNYQSCAENLHPDVAPSQSPGRPRCRRRGGWVGEATQGQGQSTTLSIWPSGCKESWFFGFRFSLPLLPEGFGVSLCWGS